LSREEGRGGGAMVRLLAWGWGKRRDQTLEARNMKKMKSSLSFA
jgi:hypothetical protein